MVSIPWKAPLVKAVELVLVILVLLAVCSAPAVAALDPGASADRGMGWSGASTADRLIRGGACADRSAPDAYLQNEDWRHADG